MPPAAPEVAKEPAEEGEGSEAALAPHPAKTSVISASPTPAPTIAAAAEGSLADELLARLKPFLSERHVEVEARLCSFSAPQLLNPDTPSPNAAPPGPEIVNGSYGRIQVGVSASDFARMRVFVESEKKLPMQHVRTEDIITTEGRYTYAVAGDGSTRYLGCVEKKRLCNVEVYVPGCPYDIRLSLSTEVPRAASETAPVAKPQGFVRRKSRWTAVEGTFEYDFTRVGDINDKKATYEVEVEGVHANAQEGVTAAWLAELMDRLLAVARLEGNTGLPRNTTYPRTGEKRQR
jgi:hypothetical protein